MNFAIADASPSTAPTNKYALPKRAARPPAGGEASEPPRALTDHQRDILRFIVDSCRLHAGVPPTIREIGRAVGISSTSVVAYQLRGLRTAGLIRLGGDPREIRNRRIEVVGATWSPPAGLAAMLAGGEG